MPRRKSWLSRIGDGLRNIWREIRPEPEPIPENEGPPEYDFPPPGIDEPGTIPHTYLPEWGPNERRFWDAYPLHNPDFFYTHDRYVEAQEQFDEAFIRHGLTKAERDESRARYFSMMGQPKSTFAWGYFRDYIRRAGTPK